MVRLLGSFSGLPRLGSFSWLPQPPVLFSTETLTASLFAAVSCDIVFSPSLYWSESATWVRCVGKPRFIFPIHISVPAKSLPGSGLLRAFSRCPMLIFPVIRHKSYKCLLWQEFSRPLASYLLSLHLGPVVELSVDYFYSCICSNLSFFLACLMYFFKNWTFQITCCNNSVIGFFLQSQVCVFLLGVCYCYFPCCCLFIQQQSQTNSVFCIFCSEEFSARFLSSYFQFFLFIQAVLDLFCCVHVFSSCDKQELLSSYGAPASRFRRGANFTMLDLGECRLGSAGIAPCYQLLERMLLISDAKKSR